MIDKDYYNQRRKMTKLTISTPKDKCVVDMSERVQLAMQQYTIGHGIVHLYLTHTTAALTTTNLDPNSELDLLDAFSQIAPKIDYRYSRENEYAGDHIMASMIGNSLLVPIQDGRLVLGTYQRIVLVEFNGPREREVVMTFLKGDERW